MFSARRAGHLSGVDARSTALTRVSRPLGQYARVAETALVVTGRERELATLRSFFAARAGRRALVLEGDAGAGKTTLWQAGASLAAAAGHRVLRSAPAAAEARLSFAALGDLLDGVLDTSRLPEPQRRALEVALLRREPDGPPPDARTIGAALRSIVRALAARSPVTLAIDDVQWLDEPSRGALEFALRRLDGAPVAVLLARRDAAAPLPLGLTAAQRVAVGPLGLAPLHRVLRGQLGVAFPRPVLRRIHAAAGGNPFFALELGRALQRRGAVSGDDPLPLPPTPQEVVAERLQALPEDVQRGLELLAGLFDRRLAVAHEIAPGLLDAAVAAGVLAIRGERYEFAHPLLESAVYAAMGPERRLEVHARLARETIGDEERALHLALGTAAPDVRVADELAACSRRALERGAAHAAGRLAEHAARLTPDAETAGHRLVAAAARYAQAGDIARCGALMDDLVARTGPGPLRAQALSLLAWTGPRAGELARSARPAGRALAEVGDDGRR
jgi:hypothetical protein